MPGSRLRHLAALALLVASACTSAPAPAAAPSPSPSPSAAAVRVGAGPGVEPRLLAATMMELLEAAAIPVTLVERADASAVRQAMELGAVDVMAGYTGATWLEVLERPDPPPDPRTSFARVREADERDGIVWLPPGFASSDSPDLSQPPANATFAFVTADPDLADMTQLATRLGEQPDARVCVDPEFARREDGLPAVWRTYGVRVDRPVFPAAPPDAILGVAAGDCLVGLATATDGAAWGAGLHPLIDDLRVFPAFVVTAQTTAQIRDRRPEVAEALVPLTRYLTTRRLGLWNARVTGGEPLEGVAEAAARELLEAAGRQVPPPPPTSPSP